MDAAIRTSITEAPVVDLSPTRKAGAFSRTRNSCVCNSRTTLLGPSQLRESTKRNSNVPILSGGGTIDQALTVSEIKSLTFNTKTTKNEGLTRKHHLAMDGHIGHGRSLSQTGNFMTFNYEGKGNYPSIGYGSDIQKLQQEKKVKVLPV